MDKSLFEEYKIIASYYGDNRARRSGVKLINHIDEGFEILSGIGDLPDIVYKAYAIHPIVQGKIDIDVSWSEAYNLAIEYAEKANAYLCKPENDWISTFDDLEKQVGSMSQYCAYMLYADKVQNFKDCVLYHKPHLRYKELCKYFTLWISYLSVVYLI